MGSRRQWVQSMRSSRSSRERRIAIPNSGTTSSLLRDSNGSLPPAVTRRGVKGTKAEDAISVRLEGGEYAAASARRALGRLRGDLDPPLMETMRLLVTELVANSVKHAGADAIDLRVIVTQPAVWAEVGDFGPGFEPSGRAGRNGEDDERGWGLFLVERLAERWGVNREGNTTRVWFEMRRAR